MQACVKRSMLLRYQLKGGFCNFFILSLALLGIICGGEIVKEAHSNLKMVQHCKISSFLGLKIRCSGFGGGGCEMWCSGFGGFDDDYDDCTDRAHRYP